MRITGRTTRGEGRAHINYPVMIAVAATHCPEIADCGQYGTINVKLDQDIDKGLADCWTPRTTWRSVYLGGNKSEPQDRIEEFGFTRIKFEYPLEGNFYDAWIIMPSGHEASYYDARLVEIIAAALIGDSPIQPCNRCAIHLEDSPQIQRPQSFGSNWAPLIDQNRRRW